MQFVVKWLYLVALIVWVGEIIFFSFAVAPSVFRTLASADAGRAVGAIFPTYYWIGYVCGAVLLVADLILLTAASARTGWIINGLLVSAMLAATVYAGMVVQPRASLLRPQLHEATTSQATKDEFSRLHRTAVRLNGAVLACGIAVSAITAAALRP